MRTPLILVSLLCIQSCGTVTTLSEPDQRISDRLRKNNSYCESIPRVYSGLSYDLCRFNSKPPGTQVDFIAGFYLLDGVLSAVSDTVVLPYTIYQQVDKGSIPIGD